MDTASDFIQPEFLNILFFKQDNLVVFPYVDLKHLHGLQVFTTGHQLTPLDSTAIYDIKAVLEAETYNSYSPVPNLYLIHGLNSTGLKDILAMEEMDVRCILNVNENVSTLANGAHFVFYNKKSKKFINFQEDDLDFEKHLISTSEDETILMDTIQKVKITASKIYNELNSSGDHEKIALILQEYPPKFWSKILQFTANYFKIVVPEASEIQESVLPKANSRSKSKAKSKSLESLEYTPEQEFTREYDFIIASNRHVSNEFIKLLFDYKKDHVNQSNLGMEQLVNPSKLYVYLRAHHWENGIPEEFISDWIQMKKTGHSLTEEEINSFEDVFDRLNVSNEVFDNLVLNPPIEEQVVPVEKPLLTPPRKVKARPRASGLTPRPPSIKDFPKFKQWMRDAMNEMEQILKQRKRP